MLRSISMRSFMEWKAFDAISPIGDRRGDWQAASIVAGIFNAFSIFVRRSTLRFRPSEFLLEFKTKTDDASDKKEVKEEPAAPTEASTPAKPWQHLKWIARTQVALANAEQKKRKPNVRRR